MVDARGGVRVRVGGAGDSETSRRTCASTSNFRHTGASHIGQRGRDPRPLLAVVKMMGDTSVATVNRHYFNLDDDIMQEIIDGWAVPDVEVFAPDQAPICCDQPPLSDDELPITV